MEQRQFDAMLEDWLSRQRQKNEALGREAEWAANAGITDGTAGQAFVTRDETAAMLRRALEYFFRQLVAVLERTE